MTSGTIKIVRPKLLLHPAPSTIKSNDNIVPAATSSTIIIKAYSPALLRPPTHSLSDLKYRTDFKVLTISVSSSLEADVAKKLLLKAGH